MNKTAKVKQDLNLVYQKSLIKEQKQLINSVVQTQKELEKTVNLIKSVVAGVKKEVSGLSVSLEDISHNNGTTNKPNKLPKPVMVSSELQTIKLKHEFEDLYPERTIKSNPTL